MMKNFYTLLIAFVFSGLIACRSDHKQHDNVKNNHTEQVESTRDDVPNSLNRVKREKDPYYGWGKKIKEYLKSNEIPDDLPTYSGQGKQAYLQELVKWSKSNIDQIKDSMQNKIQKFESE